MKACIILLTVLANGSPLGKLVTTDTHKKDEILYKVWNLQPPCYTLEMSLVDVDSQHLM